MRMYENCDLGFRKWGSCVKTELLVPDVVNPAQRTLRLVDIAWYTLICSDMFCEDSLS